ncbi:MAG: HAD family phosphatase [Parachlamydiaceae bacterium]|nr:HAD family phosphatase [Parachlamydiaceae bacterium]
MDWIDRFQLFLFDLDGLLVNTEELHFLAYKNMLKNRGYDLAWDFLRYCRTAHYHSDKIASELYEMFPTLLCQEPSWDILYLEKKQAMIHLLEVGAVQLMPGVLELLTILKERNLKHCVVTHSPNELVELIRKQHPILNSIPNWITRRDYVSPKPSSECYLKAIKMYASEGDKIIGFEDSPRGLRALMGTRALTVIVCDVPYPEIEEFTKLGALHYINFTELLSSNLGVLDIKR